MDRWLRRVTSAVVVLLGTAGCEGTCDDLCDKYAHCDPHYYARYLDGCDWDGSPAEVEEVCLEDCEDAYDALSDQAVEDVDACVECLLEKTEGTCSGIKREAAADACESRCDDDDVLDFFEDFVDEWNPDFDCPDDWPGPTG